MRTCGRRTPDGGSDVTTSGSWRLPALSMAENIGDVIVEKDYVGVWAVKDVTIKNSGLHVRLGARVASAI